MRGSTLLVGGFLSLVLLVLPACLGSAARPAGSGESNQEPKASILPETDLEAIWGANGARLTLTGAEGRLEFDCGGAVIDRWAVSSSQRRFRGTGHVLPATGGPAVYPTPPGRAPRPVRFRGRLEGDTLRLVLIRPKPRRLGEARRTVLRLDRDHPGVLEKCL